MAESEEQVNILLVDDRSENLVALEAILDELGVNLVQAHSGEDALRCLLRQDVALIVLDVQMPGMDGFETASLIRERDRTRNTPIIFLTGISTSDFHIAKGYALNAVDYLLKPIVPAILKTKVAVFVNLYRMTAQIKRQAARLAAANLELEREIAERKRAEEALRESEARFRRLAENAPDVIYRYRVLPKPGLAYLSPSIAMLSGYTWTDFETDPDLDRKLVHPDDQPIRDALIQSFTEGSPPSDPITLRWVRKDGGVVWVEHRVVPVHAAAGEVVAIEGIARDVTEHMQTQELLEQRVVERTHEIERRRQVAEGLRDILATLNSNLPLEQTLNTIVGQAGRMLSTSAVAIYRLQNHNGQLSIEAAHGLDVNIGAPTRIPVGQGAVGQAVLTCQPVVISDFAAALRSDDLEPHRQALLAHGHRAVLAVPLMIKNQVYGGIVLYYPQPRAFSEEDIRIAVTLADQVALALENAQLRAEAEVVAVAAERNRLARDLHDSVTQTLFSSSVIAEVLPRLWERNPDEGRRRLEDLRKLTTTALAEMRALLVELRPTILVETKLGDLLHQLIQGVSERVKIPMTLTVEGDQILPPEVQMAIYRIAQEALNNVARHSEARQAGVSLRCQPEAVELAISDDGRGFDPENIPAEHLGLGIMRERAQAIGATLTIEGRVGHGTQIVVRWIPPHEQGHGG